MIMESSPGVKSDDSAATSDEYEIVSERNVFEVKEPRLRIANNGNLEDLENSLKEVLAEDKSTDNSKMDASTSVTAAAAATGTTICSPLEKDPPIEMKEERKVGRRVTSTTVVDNENGTIQHHPLMTPPPEAGDSIAQQFAEQFGTKDEKGAETMMEGNRGEKPMPDMQEECTIFHRVRSLGAATINAPRSEGEIQRNIALLAGQASEHAIEIAVSIPSISEGSVILYDASTQTEMTRFKIHRILFFARGAANSTEEGCFAFTCSHGETQESAIFQCHVFRCDIPEAVGRVFSCFAKAFQCEAKLQSKNLLAEKQKNGNQPSSEVFMFEVVLEIREDDGKGNFSAVPKDRSCFKLRTGLEKKLVLTVQQVSENTHDLIIERCFGLLVSPGRNVKHSDMQLIEMISMGTGAGERKSYVIWGHWDPNDPTFEVLNQETPRDARVFMTIAVDLVIRGIQEPIRFTIETRAKIYPQNERFWYLGRRQLVQQFSLQLKKLPESTVSEKGYDVVNIETAGEIDRNRVNLALNLANFIRSPSAQSMDTPKDEDESDSDEPMQSGMGEVSKDCSAVELVSWAEVLAKWQQNLSQRPKQLPPLVKQGIPEALRGEVWQRLVCCESEADMMEMYRTLLAKECSSEEIILRDINRTFPANDFFKESGGVGQDSLYKISKAYAVYDMEVGYCQGLSFLGAALLLHMPEEQAFCVMVKIMYDYGLRDLFKDGFENLHMKLYQLDKLMEEQIPELWMHFVDLGVESHMYGSQWFLTLFTAKFPLFLVFHILDVFLLQGMDTLFQVGLALLMMSKKDLLALDFEGILKYFRVSLPKKYRHEDIAKHLMKLACSLKVKKLKKYEKEYLLIKDQERNQVDPETRLTRDNKRLMEDNGRLEVLIKELVTGKVQAEEKADAYSEELQSVKALLRETEEEKKRLEREAVLVKEILQKEVQRNEEEGKRNTAIISEYKQICSQLSRRLEDEQNAGRDAINAYRSQMTSCQECSKLLSQEGGGGFLDKLGKNKGGQVEDTDLAKQMQDLELELAQTKVALAESECRNEDLTHQLNLAISEIETSKNHWLWKTFTPFKEVTRKDSSKDMSNFKDSIRKESLSRDDLKKDAMAKESTRKESVKEEKEMTQMH